MFELVDSAPQSAVIKVMVLAVVAVMLCSTCLQEKSKVWNL